MAHNKKLSEYIDKAKALHAEAELCTARREIDRAVELLSRAKTLHCSPEILYTRSIAHALNRRYDLAYVDVAEALAKLDSRILFHASVVYLCILGRRKGLPLRRDTLDIRSVVLDVDRATAVLTTRDGEVLEPAIAAVQFNPFFFDESMSTFEELTLIGGHQPEEVVLYLLHTAPVDYLYHVDVLNFSNFFHLPWAGIERILDGQTLRASKIRFIRLQLPSDVDANELLEMPTVRECTHLIFQLYEECQSQPPGPLPLFDNASLMEWMKRSAGRALDLTSDHLSSGLHSFLDALIKDFLQTTQAHPYRVMIKCPNTKAVAGQRMCDETLSNRLGETMVIHIRKECSAVKVMGEVETFKLVSVMRLSLAD